ncbi:MAG: glycosyltransferase family 2 protein, partial [Planctomycetota bacterium]|nr:glycosyltransferase family 2 protein [Planctomycetota bacterium]
MSTRLTIQILTKNEEAALPRCLASLSGLEAEVLVIDSISTDRTREIALAAGARVLEHPFVDFASQLNWGLEQASGEWVLIIDADELLDSRLRESIRETVYHPSPLSEVYSLVRDSFFLGRRMRASAWSGERLPRLFKKGALSYSGLVHQVPDLGGRVPGLLKGRLHHHTYRSL